MMTPPNFTELNPSTAALWKEQSRLQQQADKMLQATDVVKIFSAYGELSPIGGSYQYGLMVYPDIDMGLHSQTVTKADFADLVRELASSRCVRKISTADTINFKAVRPGMPVGYWLGLEVPFENERWGIDCWLQQPDWTGNAPDKYTTKLADLDQPAKDAILRMKYDLIRLGLYGKTIMSTDVYDAVLERQIYTTNVLLELFNK